MSSSGRRLSDRYVATTGVAGHALVNGTGTVISWTAPTDGNIHAVHVAAQLVVSSLETGGQVSITVAGVSIVLFAAAKAAGTYVGGDAATPDTPTVALLRPGQTVAVVQSSALSVGAAVLYASILAD